MATGGGSSGNGTHVVDFVMRPSFLKRFSSQNDAKGLRLPREWVHTQGNHLPNFCKLIMPSGQWRVRLLNIASGCYFCDGWSDFVRDNRIHKEFLIFTQVQEWIFIVQRCDFGSGCPPREDYDSEVGELRDAVLSPDIDSDDDLPPLEDGSEEDTGVEYMAHPRVLSANEYPSFNVVLSKSNIERTLEIPMSFWKTHLLMADMKDNIYLMVEDKTWVVELECDNERIWVKHGWHRFKSDNALVKGVQCNFVLVNVDEVQFYVTFSR